MHKTSWTLNSCRTSLCGAQSSTSVYFSLASLFTPVEEIGFKGYTQNYMASPQNKSVQLFTEPSLCTNPSRPSSFLCLGLHYELFLDREVMLVSAMHCRKRVRRFERPTFTLATCHYTDLTQSKTPISGDSEKGVTESVTNLVCRMKCWIS